MIVLTRQDQLRELRKKLSESLSAQHAHLALLGDKPIGSLINNDLIPISLNAPQVQSFGSYLGHPSLPASMTINELREIVCNRLSSTDPDLTEAEIQQLEPLTQWALERSYDSTCDLTDLWLFLSGQKFPVSKHTMECAPIHDPEATPGHPPRFRLVTNVFQDCGDYDEQTGESLYHSSSFASDYFSNNLGNVMRAISVMAQYSIDAISEWGIKGCSFIRESVICDGEQIVLGVLYHIPDDYQAANTQGVSGYTIDWDSLWMKRPDQSLLNELRNTFGPVAHSKAIDRYFSQDLGL